MTFYIINMIAPIIIKIVRRRSIEGFRTYKVWFGKSAVTCSTTVSRSDPTAVLLIVTFTMPVRERERENDKKVRKTQRELE